MEKSIRRAASNRSAALNRRAVISVLLVIAGAVITGVCATILSIDSRVLVSFWGVGALVVALVICAVVGAGVVVVVNGIVNVVDGVGFRLPYALAHRDVCVASVLNLVVGCVVGGFCGFAVVDRFFASSLFVNTYAGCMLGLACACAMGIGGQLARYRPNRYRINR